MTSRVARRTGAALGSVALAGAVLSGCTSSHSDHPASHSSVASSPAAAANPVSPLVTLPAPTPRARSERITPPPNAPKATAGPTRTGDLVAVVTAARASTTQVAELHDIAVSAGRRGAIPAAVIPRTAHAVAGVMRTQATTATMLHPAAATPQSRLAVALHSYATLADSLSSWNSSTAKPLPSSFFSRLRSADAQWRSAMKGIGALAHRDLLATVPKLLYPN